MPAMPRAPWSRARRPISVDSSFDSTRKNPLCEIALEEWIHDEDWQRGKNDNGHLDRRGRWQWLADLHRPGQSLTLQHVEPQDKGDRPHYRVVEVKQRVEVIRPQSHAVEEGDHR